MAKKNNTQTWYGRLTFNDVAMQKSGIPQEPIYFVFHDGTEGNRDKPYKPETYGYDVLQWVVLSVLEKMCPDEHTREWECMVQVGKHHVKCKFEMHSWSSSVGDDNTFRVYTRELHFSLVGEDNSDQDYHLKDRQGRCVMLIGSQCPDRPDNFSQALVQMLLLE